MAKNERQTFHKLQMPSQIGASEPLPLEISYDEAIEQLERELTKVLRGTVVAKTGRGV